MSLHLKSVWASAIQDSGEVLWEEYECFIWNKETWQSSRRRFFEDWMMPVFWLDLQNVKEIKAWAQKQFLQGREKKTNRVKLLTWLFDLLSIMCALTTSRICVVNSFISSRGMILKATRLFLFWKDLRWPATFTYVSGGTTVFPLLASSVSTHWRTSMGAAVMPSIL